MLSMWHDFNKIYNLALEKLRKANINEFEKKSIIELTNKMMAEGIGKGRATKYLQVLRIMLERGVKIYADMHEEELYQAMTWIRHDWNIGSEAQRDYLIALKRILEYHNLIEFAELIKIKKPETKKNYLPVY